MKFSEWLLQEINSREWTPAILARKARMTRQAIGNYLNGRVPHDEELRKIASGFGLPQKTVFVASGRLPYEPEADATIDEVIYDLRHLPPH